MLMMVRRKTSSRCDLSLEASSIYWSTGLPTSVSLSPKYTMEGVLSSPWFLMTSGLRVLGSYQAIEELVVPKSMPIVGTLPLILCSHGA